MQLECKQSFTNFFIIFFYVKFAFFGVIIKTPSDGQNCHEVNKVVNYLLCLLLCKQSFSNFYSKLTGHLICQLVLKTNLTKMKMDLVRMQTKETATTRLPLSISFQLLSLVTDQLPEPMVYQLNQPGACRYVKSHYSKSQIFVLKFNFDKTPTFSRIFHPNFFYNFSREIKVVNSLKSPKPQHFHEFFTQIFFDNFSREIKVVNS